MVVAASDLSLNASHARVAQEYRTAHWQSWRGARPPANTASAPDNTTNRTDRFTPSTHSDTGTDLTQLLRRLKAQQTPTPTATTTPSADSTDAAPALGEPDAKGKRVLDLLEKVFGFGHIASVSWSTIQADSSHLSFNSSSSTTTATTGAGPAGWGLSYDEQRTSVEAESLSLSAKGTVTTTDGRVFSLDFSYRMERTSVQTSSTSIRAGDAVATDPLVIDLGGGGFSGQHTAFDLNHDGVTDQLPTLKPGSWYLTRTPGAAKNGTDLFGPQTGQGFAELARLDDDHNGFIDSGDHAFTSLGLWDGGAQTRSLADLGIGAIATGSVAADFHHTSDDGALQALNRRSGIALLDNGQAAAVHQVDVVA